jgi:uncharacterized protein (DUF342 family)
MLKPTEPELPQHTVNELFNKITYLESHVKKLESNLGAANEEIGALRRTTTKPNDSLDEHHEGLDTMVLNTYDNTKKAREKIIQKKEKNFNRFANTS